MKKSTLGYMVLAGSLALGGTLVAQQGGAAAPAAPATAVPVQPPVDPNKVVMTVGQSTMTAGQFEDFVQSLPPEVQQMARGPAKRRVAEDLMKLKLLAAEGQKVGLDQTDKFRQQMALMRDNALAGLLIAQVQPKLVTDKDIQEYYGSHKSSYEKATVRHILIATGGEKPLSDEAALAKAKDLKAKIDAGGDFAAMAKAESADPGSKEEGGLLQSFTPGQMVPEFESKAFSQKAGEVSEPVKTRYGYHIIKTEKIETSPLDEVKDEIADVLKPQKLQGYVEELKKQVNPQIDDSFFGPPTTDAAPAAPATPAPAK